MISLKCRHCECLFARSLLCFICLVASVILSDAVGAPVYTTYHWHLQQPIYWPDQSSLDANTYEKAYESLTGGASHPENDLEQIFGLSDRVAAYQYRVRDAIASIQQADGGAQISYSGCLVENVNSLAQAGVLGYADGWESANQQARGWLTTDGFPRLDIVIFPYHHALGPLIDPEALRKEIQIYKQLYPDIWGGDISVGYFPAELSFSERMIPVLVQEGVEWVFVPNNHLSRACEDFPLVLGTGGEMCDPPNRADIQNPAQSNWFSKTIERGCSPCNAYPFSYQPHKAQYIDPETGAVSQMTVVPVAQAMSWTDGYQQYGTEDIDQIAWAASETSPMLIVLAHDGDNAYGGGYSYYMENVPQFCDAVAAAGYSPTVVQQYLDTYPVSESDIVHVEDGSWINADGDFGSPDFINWNWPLFNAEGEFDIADGWAEDERNWAVITAAQNRVETAEQIAGTVSVSQIQAPDSTASNAELAWHFFLPSLTSGYMYYGTTLDMEVKPTIACNHAVEKAALVIGDGALDQTPPTIWIPQQLPHNPGATGFGSLWGYQVVEHSRDFWVWTFVSDVSGVADVTFHYRLDNDGENPLTSSQNETYAGGSEVGDWTSVPMQVREFPAGNVYDDPEIDFFEMPTAIADQYYIHVQAPEIIDEGGVLVDYYIQATDTKGYTKRSPILHTFVGTGDGSSAGSGGDGVAWTPETPRAGETLTIYYDPNEGTLPDETNPVYIHIGHSGWLDIIDPNPSMTVDADAGKWVYGYTIPSGADRVDFVFTDGQGNWDNNGGQDWSVAVTDDEFVIDGQLDASAQLLGSYEGVAVYADWNPDQLYVACTAAETEDYFIFISDGSGQMTAAPWAKSGQVSQWQAYLANESTNGWSGWFDGTGRQACGTVLEGVLDWPSEWAAMPESVFIALGAYQTDDAGGLQFQIPSGNDDGDLELSEFYELMLLGDLDFNGSVNLSDLAVFAGHWNAVECRDENDWCGGADFDMSGTVDMTDLYTFVLCWLGKAG